MVITFKHPLNLIIIIIPACIIILSLNFLCIGQHEDMITELSTKLRIAEEHLQATNRGE